MKNILLLLIMVGGCFGATANAYYYRQAANPNFRCMNTCQAQDYSNTADYCQERCAYQNTVATSPPPSSIINSNCASTCMSGGGNYPTCQAQCSSQNVVSRTNAPPVLAESNCQHYCLANGNDVIYCQQQCTGS